MATIDARPTTIQQGGRVIARSHPDAAKAASRAARDPRRLGHRGLRRPHDHQWQDRGLGRPADQRAVGVLVTGQPRRRGREPPGDGRGRGADHRRSPAPSPRGTTSTCACSGPTSDASSDQVLWSAIRNSTQELQFERTGVRRRSDVRRRSSPRTRPRDAPRAQAGQPAPALPYPDMDAYRLLKVATEVFMMVKCGVAIDPDQLRPAVPGRRPGRGGPPPRHRRPVPDRPGAALAQLHRGVRLGATGQGRSRTAFTLPYLAVIRRRLGDRAWPTARPSSGGLRRASCATSSPTRACSS